MAVELRSLRVSADFDAASYVRGAQQKVSADKSMIASSNEVAQAAVKVSTANDAVNIKVSSTVSVLERLSRQYIDGYGAAQKFNSELLRLAKASDTGTVSAEQLQQVYAGVSQRFGVTANSADLAARGFTGLAKAIDTVNASLREQQQAAAAAARIADLQQKLDPAAASAARMASELTDLAEAERLGVQITGGYEAALDRLVLKYDAGAAAIKRQADEYAALARAARDAQAADRAQGQINTTLNVRDPQGFSGSARQSASVFTEKFDFDDHQSQIQAQAMRDAAQEAEQYAKSAAALKAQLDPLWAAQEKLNDELATYNSLASRGLITADELAKAQTQAKARFEATAANFRVPANNNRPATNQANVANVGFQLQDIATTAAFMPWQTVALQQGPQLASALGESGGAAGALKTLGSAAASVLNPVSLLTIGLTGAAAAAIQYFTSASSNAKTLDDAIKAQNSSLSILKDTYHQVAEASKISSNLGGNSVASANLRANDIVQQAAFRQEGNKYLAQLGAQTGVLSYFRGQTTPITNLENLNGGQQAFKQPVNELLTGVRAGTTDFAKFQEEVEKTYQTLAKTSDGNSAAQTTATQWRAAADAVLGMADNALRVDSTIKVLGTDGKETSESLAAFQDPINRLKLGIAEGKADFAKFAEQVDAIGRATGMQRVADQVIVLGKNLNDASQGMAQLKVIQDRLFNDVGMFSDGTSGRLLSRGSTSQADDGSYAAFLAQQKVTMQRTQQAFDAETYGLNARSPAEKAEASRRQAAAQYLDESAPQRAQRIDLAGQSAQIQAEKQLTDAQDERERSLAKSIDDQQLEISLVGKTTGEAAALRQEYDRMAQVRAEATALGIKNETDYQRIFGAEIDLIKRNAAEYAKLAEERAKAQLSDDVKFQQDQLGRTPQQRVIAGQLRGAGLPIDYNSPEAKQIGALDDAERKRDMDRAQAAYEAQVAATNARTSAQRIAAAGQTAKAQAGDDQSDAQKQQAVQNAENLARIQEQRQLADAQRDRQLQLDQSITAQQQEISLIGKTAGETAALQTAYQLTAQIRMEAAKNGTQVDEKEIELIQKKAAELGRLADLYAKASLRNDLSFERDQIFRSDDDQQIASRLRSSGQPVDLNSAEANIIRDNLHMQELRDGVKGFFTDFRDGMEQGDSIGKAFGNAILNALNKVINKLSDSLFDSLTNSILGTGKPGGGGLLGLLGIGSTAITAPTAANDNFAANSTLGAFLGVPGAAANDNTPLTGNIGTYAQAIKNIESSGNYSALGPITASGDRAYGAYQVMGANVAPWTTQALGYSMTPSQFLATPSAQDAVFGKVFGGYVSKFGPSGASQAWFGGPGSVGGSGNASDLFGTTGTSYVAKFNAQLSNLSNTTNEVTGSIGGLNSATGAATSGLTSFGGGLNQFGQSLGSIAFSPQSGSSVGSFGGLFGGIGKLFGGISPTSSFWAPNTTLGGFLGLSLSGGGYTGPGGVYEPAGIVHRGEVVWSQDDIARWGGVDVVDRMRTSRPGYAYDSGGIVGAPPRRSTIAEAANRHQRQNPANDGGYHVDVGVSVDDDGNLQAYVKSISRQEAARASDRAVQTFSDKRLPVRMKEINSNPRKVG